MTLAVPAAFVFGLGCRACVMVWSPVSLHFFLFVFCLKSFCLLVAREGVLPAPREGVPSTSGEGAPSESRPVRPVRPLRSSRPKPSPGVLPSSSPSFETFLVGVPAVPTRGTPTVPVGLLLDWRAEVVASQTEYLHADAAHAAAVAAKKVADAAAKAAGAAIRVAAARREEAEKRCKHTLVTYTGFVGDVCVESVVVGGGKGKARTSSRSSAEEDEVVDLAELESDSEDEEADIMVE
jgi:hypothetical protein